MGLVLVIGLVINIGLYLIRKFWLKYEYNRISSQIAYGDTTIIMIFITLFTVSFHLQFVYLLISTYIFHILYSLFFKSTFIKNDDDEPKGNKV